jgi:arsenite/tail-anchored protein-transporting ATPase
MPQKGHPVERTPRVILYTGKGGVGKTSAAAASALRCADLGLRTIVVSTDPAHSLSDSLDVEVGPEPISLAPRFWAQEIDVLHQMDKYWSRVQEYLSTVLSWRGVNDIVAEETAIIPGMDELAGLLQIVYLAESGEYDVVIVDCAPTAETLRFLSFPEAAKWYLDKIFPMQRTAMKVARPMLRTFTDIPLPDDQLFDIMKDLIGDLTRMHDLLANPDVSSVRLVLNPDKMVIKEAQRTLTYVTLYGFTTDAVICNRVIPDEVTDPYFTVWKRAQAANLELVRDAFAPLPVFKVPMFSQELVGIDMLRRMAAVAFGDVNPAAVLHREQVYKLDKVNGAYQMRLSLPLASRDAIDLTRKRDELVVRVGSHKRNLILPSSLARLPVAGARYDDGSLVITFKETA